MKVGVKEKEENLSVHNTVLTEILRNYQYELSQPINQSMQKHAKSYSPACEKDWKCASKMEEQGLNTKTLLKDRKSAS